MRADPLRLHSNILKPSAMSASYASHPSPNLACDQTRMSRTSDLASAATYTPSGKALVFYRTDHSTPDAYGNDLINDDGTAPQTIFTGVIVRRGSVR